MNRNLRWFAGAAAFAALGVGLAPWPFSGRTLRRDIASQVADATGLHVEARGRAVFALLPRPRIKLEGVHATAAGGAFRLDAETLRGDLRILPMFAGRIELADMSLVSPRVEIDAGRVYQALASATRNATKAAESAHRGVRLASIALLGGSAHIGNVAGGSDVWLDGLNLTLDWRGLAAPLNLRGEVGWRGVLVQTALWLGKPGDALDGTGSPIVARLSTPNTSLGLDGSLALANHPQYDGKLNANAASLRAFAEAAGLPALQTRALGATSLSAAARFGAQGLALSQARLTFGGSAYDGALTLAKRDGRPALTGTLATDVLDLTPLLDALPLLATSDGVWNHGPDPLGVLTRFDADLRISAARVRSNRVQASGVGLSILANDGHFEASLADADAFRGEIAGRVTADAAPDGIAMQASGKLSHVDFAALLGAAVLSPRISGEASGDIRLAGEGADAPALLSSLRGSVALSLRGGEIAGLDIEQALRRIERRPLSIASELRGGRTPFDTADLAVTIDKGVAIVERAEGAGAGVAFTLSGATTLSTRDLAMRFLAWPVGGPSDATKLAMAIRGSWDAPDLVLDTTSLIQRSRAAAPLWRGANAADKPLASPP